MAAASFYILYAWITNTSNWIVLLSIILVTIETLILLFNKWTCPLTYIAKKHTSNRKDNFDIYLPIWLAKYNKRIFGIIFISGILLIVFNLI